MAENAGNSPAFLPRNRAELQKLRLINLVEVEGRTAIVEAADAI